jgi:2-keto-4-pentenoate hydratase/2-oxohepta-3-ene-1,7-dioic acid hydratase in catechol pathway
MMRTLTPLVVALVLAAAWPSAQPPAGETYKLGTFERHGRTFVGLVIADAWVADIEQANAAFERGAAGAPRLTMPKDMKSLIAQYESAVLKERLAALARAAGSQPRPGHVVPIASVRVRPPVMYPMTILNAAVNYAEHAAEMARAGSPNDPPAATPASESMPGLWQRKPGDTRQNPYFFLKPSSVVIAEGEAIQLPPGRDRIDWECELAVVVGTTAKRVPVERAAEYIFGYTLENDVSDRGGRGDRRHGSDWLVGKGHDTFAPMGPYIVPRAFVANPQALSMKFTLNGKVMQDSHTSRMTHNVYELLSFASHVLTLHPGDVLSMGSPAGVGTARATPIYFKAGDTSVCTIEGIGTLTNPIVAADATTGSR